MKRNRTTKKLVASVTLIIVLSICLCITTLALTRIVLTNDDNFFHTGIIKINLNDGKPVIEEHEFLFEPGMTVKKDFFIENQSTWDVYYKLYFDDIDGGLANVLEITIKDDDKILYQGHANELVMTKVKAADDMLRLNERRNLTVYFHFPKEAGNSAQSMRLTFSMKAQAVQTKNNPNKLFD